MSIESDNRELALLLFGGCDPDLLSPEDYELLVVSRSRRFSPHKDYQPPQGLLCRRLVLNLKTNRLSVEKFPAQSLESRTDQGYDNK